MRRLAVIAVVLALSGCQAGPPWQQWMYEGPKNETGEEFPPLYVEGWKHGCETGVSATTNHLYKFFYKFRQDPALAGNPAYRRGWKTAFDYCQRYMYMYLSREFF